MQILRDELRRSWRLAVREGSEQMIVPPDGCDHDGDYWDVCGWRVYRSMNILGQRIAWDGLSSYCWRSTATAAWRQFSAVVGTKSIRTLLLELRLRRFHSTILPLVSDRMPRWVWGTAQSLSLDRLQRRFVAIIQRPCPLEEPAACVRRRGRQAAAVQATAGTWSSRHAHLVQW